MNRRPGTGVRGGLRRIFVVFKTHFDIGFTGLVDEVLHSYAQVMVPQALEAIRGTAANEPGHRYVWTLPAWPLANVLRALEGTMTGNELEQCIRDRLVAWHALPLTTHTELFGLEDFIRGLYVARGLRTRFGRASIAAKMTDVPGHTWILPTLLAHAGVSFLHLGCNACSMPPDVPLLFHWEGPDGSRVATMYSEGGYGSALFPPSGWKLPIWLALQHTSDNAGPQRVEVVREILRSVTEGSPGTEVIFGSLDDFAHALAELDPDLPVVRKDLADSWIHGAGSMPGEVSALREVRNRLKQVESAIALRAHQDADRDANSGLAAEIASAYEKILLFGEHTWGMDTKLALNPPEFGGRVYDKELFRKILASGKYERIQRSWNDKRKLLADAQEQLGQIERGLDRGSPQRSAALPAAFELVNHHLWEWAGQIRLGRFPAELSVEREPGRAPLPVFQLNGEAWVQVRGLPPLSRARIVVRARDGAPARFSHPAERFRAVVRRSGDRLILENGRIRLRLDESRGGVTSLGDLENGREWADSRSGGIFGAYRYDIYSRREIVSYLKSYAYDLEHWFLDDFGKPGYPDRPHETFTGELARADIEQGAGWARARVVWRQDTRSVREMGNPEEVVQSVTLFDDQPWVDFHYLLSRKQESPLLEAGHVVFPFRCARPRYVISKTGSVIDPARDIAKDANRLLYCCESWLDVSNEKGGMLVIPVDCPLVSIGSPAIERFDGSSGPGKPTLFFNLFNTQWGTNFPQWIGGDFSFQFRLVPHAGDWRNARAWEHSAATLQPPACLPVSPDASSTPPPGLLAKPVTGLETVCVKTAEDGRGLILRLREPSGRAGKRTLHFRMASGTAPRVSLCSLLEDEVAELPLVSSGRSARVMLQVRPFEVLTLKLETGRRLHSSSESKSSASF